MNTAASFSPSRQGRPSWLLLVGIMSCLVLLAAAGGSAIFLFDRYPKHQLQADPSALSEEGTAINVLGKNWDEGGSNKNGTANVNIYVLAGHDQQPSSSDTPAAAQVVVSDNGMFARAIKAHTLPAGPYTVFVISEADKNPTASVNITLP